MTAPSDVIAGDGDGLLVIAHGTVDSLEDLPPFLAAIRRGHAAPPELICEVRRRYEAIGGRSPLNDICREVTRKLGGRLGVPAVFAARMWDPKPEQALEELARRGVTRVMVVPLAQHSGALYVETVRAAARARVERGAPEVLVVGPANWGQEPKLTLAFAASLARAIARVPQESRAAARVLFTAHSLPISILRGGDPYEREVRASAASVAALLSTAAGPGPVLPHEVIFQSQGLSGGEWLGPDVESTLSRLAHEGVKHVVLAPIGFLADHVEILYDLDIEARAWASARGMGYTRMESLNAGDGFIDALVAVVAGLS